MLEYEAMITEARTGVGIEEKLHRTVGEMALNRMKKVSIEAVVAEKRANGEPLSLYVHIPFCTEICSFCAFHRRVGNGAQREEYAGALESHIEKTLTLFGKDQEVSSVYFGGGTPGLLTPEQAGRVMSSIKSAVDIDGVPITYELHPENITPEYILALQNLGIGRFSVGVQNLSEEERRVLGRTLTTGDEDIERLQILNDLGVQYNLDLIFGTPTQTQRSWRETVERIVSEVMPPEITLYQYVNAHGSETKKLLAQGLLTRPGFRSRYAMYEFARNFLLAKGYSRTNTQSFSRDRKESNRVLLNQGGDFLGVGPKTYSRVGRYLFINDSRTSDFRQGGDMADYYGVRFPKEAVRALDKGFAFFARQNGARHGGLPLPDLGIVRSEAITQAYGVLYYVTNQPRMQTRLAGKRI